jgi:DNA-binding LacI/PurR family transcriptional regulator
MAKKITVHDVARSAGVSASTVSRVARGMGRVSPDVEKRVREAAQELGFDRISGTSAKIVTFLLSNREMMHYFHSRVLVGAQDYLAGRDYDVLHFSFRYPASVNWKALRLPDVLLRRDLVAGFIVAGANTKNLLELLSRREIPFVVFGNNVFGDWPQDQCDTVWSDENQGGYEMTRHLQSLGHRDIWYVGNCSLPWYARCFQGFSRAMTEAGLPPRISGFDTDKEEELGYLATKSLLGQHEPVTAIFAGGDMVAQGVYRALHDCGLSIPGDISVAGYNDIEAERFHPPLTSVRVFSEQIGKSMAEMLLNRLNQPSLPPQRLALPTQVMRRDSCQPLPGHPGTANGQRVSPSAVGT